MTQIVWGEVGSRFFETGIDRGVLYVDDNPGVPWNGLTGVEEDRSGASVTPYYFDGVKHIDVPTLTDFAATIQAITYPDEFLPCQGIEEATPGLLADNQAPKPFGLCYRTLVGNDVDGIEHGYKIHLLYNLTAVPTNIPYESLDDALEPIEFGWSVTSRPEKMQSYLPTKRPTGHVIIDSGDLDPEILEAIEDILYGTETEEPRLLSYYELVLMIVGWGELLILDNGDGTWTAYGDDTYITDLGDGEFEITADTVVVLSPDEFEVSSTV